MAYDVELAGRVRDILADGRDVRDVKMFGGLAFMVDGAMVACVTVGGGALLVRVSPERDAELLDLPGATRAEMGTGRSMGPGWIAVDDDALADQENLAFWISEALAFHAEQPEHRGTRKTRR